MMALRVKDVMTKDGKIKNVVQLTDSLTKSKRSRDVSLSPQAQYYLNDWLHRQPKERLGRNRPVFWSGDWRLALKGLDPHTVALHEDAAKKALKRLFEKAGVHGASSHSLRATHGTRLLENGVDISLVSKQLGHSRLSTTREYLSVTDEKITNAVQQLQF